MRAVSDKSVSRTTGPVAQATASCFRGSMARSSCASRRPHRRSAPPPAPIENEHSW